MSKKHSFKRSVEKRKHSKGGGSKNQKRHIYSQQLSKLLLLKDTWTKGQVTLGEKRRGFILVFVRRSQLKWDEKACQRGETKKSQLYQEPHQRQHRKRRTIERNRREGFQERLLETTEINRQQRANRGKKEREKKDYKLSVPQTGHEQKRDESRQRRHSGERNTGKPQNPKGSVLGPSFTLRKSGRGKGERNHKKVGVPNKELTRGKINTQNRGENETNHR